MGVFKSVNIVIDKVGEFMNLIKNIVSEVVDNV